MTDRPLTRFRALNAPTLIALVVLAGVLAGCRSGGSSPATSAVGATAPGGADNSSAAGLPTATSSGASTTSAAGCPEAVTSNTHVQVTSARVAGNTVVVTAEPARRVCTGPNNGHYEIGSETEHLTLTPSATVVLLTTTASGVGHETVAPTDLPQRLSDDRFGRIFVVHGPASAVTSLEEQYHP